MREMSYGLIVYIEPGIARERERESEMNKAENMRAERTGWVVQLYIYLRA